MGSPRCDERSWPSDPRHLRCPQSTHWHHCLSISDCCGERVSYQVVSVCWVARSLADGVGSLTGPAGLFARSVHDSYVISQRMRQSLLQSASLSYPNVASYRILLFLYESRAWIMAMIWSSKDVWLLSRQGWSKEGVLP